MKEETDVTDDFLLLLGSMPSEERKEENSSRKLLTELGSSCEEKVTDLVPAGGDDIIHPPDMLASCSPLPLRSAPSVNPPSPPPRVLASSLPVA
eukprot:768805-Hanusia_phi.AAC.1